MTTLSDTLGNDGAFDALSITTVPRRPTARRREALGLLLTGMPRGDAPAVDQFLGFARQQRLSLDHFWAAYQDGQPLAAALIVGCAGRTGMLFISPVHDQESADLTGRVIAAAVAALRPGAMSMVQALLDAEQATERSALWGGGFRRLAELKYMVRRSPPATQADHDAPPPPSLPEPLRLVTWKRSRKALFGRAILASYQDTADCPGLVGLRDADDIIAGHQATGRFDPDLWHVALAGEEPAAVMLLNPIPQRGAMELVYLGLTPAWRGRGVGGALLDYGLALARRRKAGDVVLAVDADNAPAVRLYERRGFVCQSHKTAFVCALTR
jgi:GNAT superfamily N-acetyltransferase